MLTAQIHVFYKALPNSCENLWQNVTLLNTCCVDWYTAYTHTLTTPVKQAAQQGRCLLKKKIVGKQLQAMIKSELCAPKGAP